MRSKRKLVKLKIKRNELGLALQLLGFHKVDSTMYSLDLPADFISVSIRREVVSVWVDSQSTLETTHHINKALEAITKLFNQ